VRVPQRVDRDAAEEVQVARSARIDEFRALTRDEDGLRARVFVAGEGARRA
jgi:hypothetical protein